MKKFYFSLFLMVLTIVLLCPNQTMAQVFCPAPTGITVSSVSQNGAYLYLTPTSTNTGTFNIRYHSNTTTAWTTLTNVTLPYQIGNLSCGAVYVCQLQAICPTTSGTVPSLSDWSTELTFTTAACIPPTVCPPPAGLATNNISQNSAFVTSTAATGTFNIRYHNSTTTSWTTVNNVTLPYQLGNFTCGTGYVWQAQTVCTTTTGTTLLSDWSAESTFSTLACTPVCTTPSGLSATNLTQTGATLYLTPTSTNNGTFNIRYHSGASTTWTTVNNVTLPYQLGYLACGTTYEWQAQTVCYNGSNTPIFSDWSTGASFTTVACTPVCPTPTGLTVTNISQTGAYLYLTPTSANTGMFNIRYHSSTTTAWTTLTNVTLPYQLGNLACGTGYVWQVQANCSTTAGTPTLLSNWSAESTFSTLACTTVCPIPSDLSATNLTQTGATLYLTPTSTNTGTFNIRYHAGTTTTWTTVNNVTLPYQLGNLACGTVYEWQAQTVCYNGSNTPTFSDWSVASTFTTVACTPVCPTPTGLTATNISQTGAYLYLTPTSANTGTFNIRYHSNTTTAWTTLTNVTLPYQLGNLACGATYVWQVQTVCPTTPGIAPGLSNWSSESTFTTLVCTTVCPVPTGLSATNVSQNGATLYLSPTSTNTGTFNIRYHSSNSTTWTTITNVSLPYQLNNLVCGTTFEWQAQLVCATTSPNYSSAWSAGAIFTTLACPTPCYPPTGLTAANVGQTEAYLYLVPTANNTGSFNIRYHMATSLTWTTLTNVSLPYQLNNLACGSVYEWQVQTICPSNATGTANTVSPWSATATFTTAPCTSGCNPPLGLVATNISQTSASLYWTASSGAQAYQVRYIVANSPSATYTTFNTTTNTATVTGLLPNTTYIWQVQAICSTSNTAGNVSVPSPNGYFTTAALVAYPNPANQVVNLSFWSGQAQTVTIQLRNSFGSVAYSSTQTVAEGNNDIQINTEELADGVYVLSMDAGGTRRITKVVIKH